MPELADPSLMRTQAFVAGEWRDADETIPIVDPGKNEPFTEVASCTAAEAEEAIDAAEKVLPEWQEKTAEDRCAILAELHQLIRDNEEDLAKILTLEHGKPLDQARGEIRYANSFVKWFAEEGRRAYGDLIPSADAAKRLLVFRQPVGITVGITPWNFPSAMITRKLAPALAVGCTFALKPAQKTPLSALALAALCERAGVPAGVVSVIPSSSASAISKPWLEDFRVRKLSFTGSTEIGKKLYEGAGETIKKISLELGGNAPFLVFDDADIDAAVDGIMKAKFRNAGQSCVAANRFIVSKAIHDELVEKLKKRIEDEVVVGYGFDEGVTLGPLIDEVAVSKVERLVGQATDAGAEVVVGGKRHDAGLNYFQPTLMTGVDPKMDLTCEEIFGPVIPVMSFEDESEAIRMANDTPFGLASYFYSQDLARVWRVSEALEYGMVGVNTGLVSNAAAPFGGIKASGQGREGSRYGLEDWTELKYVAMGGLG
ncbi:MAG: succinate-semialdehyde dehydrogenase (NADP(+)) [Sandaracinus sp.]|nr:succinate-semialdehyde dehydrogenase (NADP(+)) [Sandaracinus sp.]MAQ19416.1 succinate-semialdehyde dehydrogenase (NADP(+)) [Sandaracinus sp.]|tara:strand:- start:796 stop:2253 length:1458 start_codon:yes stop_codon:yes gene_type:complete